ncbi:MAG: 2-hydroxyglutaryl-CoA dehydratase [Acidobacteria bacterium]|nr:2-hydroxyglutaryl-CoA dehydratase [Acidobacteriota bacterium]
MIVAGVDVGSTATKAVVMDENLRVLGRGLVPTGANVTRAAERVFAVAIAEAGLNDCDVSYIVGTGYGRYKVSFGHAQITEISCHARGAAFLFPETRTIVDIGGQDTKAIRIAAGGEVLDFSMNDKCAAGTGRFLESAAQVMGIELEELGPLSLASRLPLKITNVCTVFVETEIMSHLARGKKPEDILRGVHNSIASRTMALLRRVGIEEAVTFTGGVARNGGIVEALEERLGVKLRLSPDSQFIGALGAALFALERSNALGTQPLHAAEQRG